MIDWMKSGSVKREGAMGVGGGRTSAESYECMTQGVPT